MEKGSPLCPRRGSFDEFPSGWPISPKCKGQPSTPWAVHTLLFFYFSRLPFRVSCSFFLSFFFVFFILWYVSSYSSLSCLVFSLSFGSFGRSCSLSVFHCEGFLMFVWFIFFFTSDFFSPCGLSFLRPLSALFVCGPFSFFPCRRFRWSFCFYPYAVNLLCHAFATRFPSGIKAFPFPWILLSVIRTASFSLFAIRLFSDVIGFPWCAARRRIL